MEGAGQAAAAGARRSRRTEQREIAHRRRRAGAVLAALAGLSLIIGAVVGAGAGGSGSDGDSSGAAAAEPPPAELPRGGLELLPANRLVGYYGAPQDEALGALGIGSPAEASAELARQAADYEGDRPVLPFLELISTVANADPGEDGAYRFQQPRSVIDDYLEQARADRSLLVLDIQPGQASFPDEVDRLESYLREPDVGLALDPEWHVAPGEVPGQVIGSVDARVVNQTAKRLSEIVEQENLPQKLLIIHQFTDDMIINKERLRTYPGVAMVLNVDGFGDPPNKISKYDELHAPKGSGLFSGFKLFYEEDLDLLSPREVMKLKPAPDLVVYE